ncbi:MAG TPA: DNA mismatch repair endonuclease MutL [Candidatus Deferrimicrobium sp.]|nr:DNA mismatch repair endonuclease MutL [Candidatus Deferrimicrobium sp.]
MASRIRPLPDDVVNRIAAGEVVERPASVLKELLENAVDSGAGSVEAHVSGPFPFSLRVTDDGCGMSREEAELAVRRHTTSKIATADDLGRIGSFGFRGEALPSIASVARVSIVTRPEGERIGTELVVEGGTILSVREAGAPRGTTVTVSGLFENVPARRKFLKSERTEMSHLWDVFHGVAIPGEGISFRFIDPRGAFAYESRESALDRAKRHAGDDGQYLVPIDVSSAFFRIFGWAGLPQISRAAAGGLWFFVNGRRFRDRSLYAAVREAYRGILPGDRLPVLYLFVTCSPLEVDVNVHPAKTEVRFRYPRDLNELARHVLGGVLGETPSRAAFPAPAWGKPSPPGGPGRAGSPPDMSAEGVAGSLFPPPPAAGAERIADQPFAERQGEATRERFFSSLFPIGQAMATYLVCEDADGIVLVDQHAADERIVFSRLKDRYLGAGSPTQRWLDSVDVALPGVLPEAEERPAVETFLARTGFSFEPAGGGRIRLTGGPAALPGFDARRWWEDLCESLRAQEILPKDLFDADRELWRMACHTAVRGGDRVSTERARLLLAELDAAMAAHSCPHGRPVWIRISRARLEALFHRTG